MIGRTFWNVGDQPGQTHALFSGLARLEYRVELDGVPILEWNGQEPIPPAASLPTSYYLFDESQQIENSVYRLSVGFEENTLRRTQPEVFFNLTQNGDRVHEFRILHGCGQVDGEDKTALTFEGLGVAFPDAFTVNGSPITLDDQNRFFANADTPVLQVVQYDNTVQVNDSIGPGQLRLIAKTYYTDYRLSEWYYCPNDLNAAPPSGNDLGMCRDVINGGQVCKETKECECEPNNPAQTNLTYDVFFPGESECRCCCYPSHGDLVSVNGAFTVDNAQHTFGTNSIFAGQPAFSFISDSATLFGTDGRRVVIIPADYKFPYTNTNRSISGTSPYTSSSWEFDPPQCGSSYAWASWGGETCDSTISPGRHYTWSSGCDVSVPVYRSATFESTGLDESDFDSWAASELAAGLDADCNATGWDWNVWLNQVERNRLVNISVGRQEIRWETEVTTSSQPTTPPGYPAWGMADQQSTSGMVEITGRLEHTLTYGNDCPQIRTHNVGTGDGFDVPVVSDDCYKSFGCCSGGVVLGCYENGVEITCPSCGDYDWGYRIGDTMWSCWAEPDDKWCMQQVDANPDEWRFLENYCTAAFYSDVHDLVFPVADCETTAVLHGPPPDGGCTATPRGKHSPARKITVKIRGLTAAEAKALNQNPLP